MLAWLAGAALFMAGLGLGGSNAFLALLGTAVLTPFDFALQFGGATIYTNEAYLAGVAAGLLWQYGRRPGRLREAAAAGWPPLLFLAAVLLSVPGAQDSAAAWKQGLRWAEFALVFLLAATAVRKREQATRLLQVLFGAAAALAAFGLFQCLMGDRWAANVAQAARRVDTMQGIAATRAYATFGHPNLFAGYLILVLPLAFGSLLEEKHRLRQVLLGAVVLVMGLALALTYSRGGWLGAGAGLGLVLGSYFPRHPRKAAWILFAAVAVAAGMLLSSPKLQARLSALGSVSRDAAVTGRIGYQKMALAMIREKPWLGHGGGNYPRVLERYVQSDSKGHKYLDAHIHNLYSQIAIETGVAGLAAFLAFIGIAIGYVVRGVRRLPPGEDRTRLIAALAGAVAFLIHNNFDVLIVTSRGIHFALILGLGSALAVLAVRGQAPDPGNPA